MLGYSSFIMAVNEEGNFHPSFLEKLRFLIREEITHFQYTFTVPQQNETLPKEEDLYVNRKQACAILRCQFTKLHDLMKSKELRYKKFGGKTLFLRSDLEDYLKKIPFNG